MASTAVAKEATQHQEKQGRAYYEAFVTWCDKSGAIPSPALMMSWDETHNLSRFKSLFGTDQDVYRAGLLALYTRAFYNYSTLRIESPSGKSVSISPYRKGGPGVGNMVDLSSKSSSKAQLDFVWAKAKSTARNAAERLRVFDLSKREVIILFTEAVEEAFAD